MSKNHLPFNGKLLKFVAITQIVAVLFSSMATTVSAVAATYSAKKYIPDLIVQGDPVVEPPTNNDPGTGKSGDFIVIPSTYDYGQVAVGSYATKNVTLKNNGTGLIKLGGATINNPAITSVTYEKCPTYLTAGSSCTAIVKFTPSLANNNYQSSVQFKSSVNDAPFSFTGSGSSASVSIVPTDLDFGVVEVGSTSAYQSVTITNVTDSPVSLTGASVDATQSFDIQNYCSIIPVGGSCLIKVRALATSGAADVSKSSLAIAAKTGNITTRYSVSLSKTVPTGELSINPSIVDSGSSTLDGSKISDTVTIKNIGSRDIKNFSLFPSLDGGITYTSNCPATLTVGQECLFKTSAIADKDKTLVGAVYLTYTGVQDMTSVAVQYKMGSNYTNKKGYTTLSPVSVNYGDIVPDSNRLASSAVKTVTVSYIAASEQDKAQVTIASTDNEFIVSNNTCQGVWLTKASSSCTFDVKYQSATGFGDVTKSVTVTTKDLKGVSTDTDVFVFNTSIRTPKLSVSPSTLAYGTSQIPLATNVKSVQSVTIQNSGNATASGITAGVANNVFSIDSQFSSKCAVLKAGASCTFDVGAISTVANTFTDSLQINATSSLFMANLDSSFNVGLSANISNAPYLQLSTNKLDFGTITTAMTIPARTVILSNIGGSSANIADMQVLKGMYNFTHNCPSQIAAQSSCMINIVPIASSIPSGVMSDTFKILESDGKETAVSLSSTIDNSGVSGLITVSKSALQWTNLVPFGETGDIYDIEIHNGSVYDLSINSAIDNTSFVEVVNTGVSPSCGSLLSAGQSCYKSIQLAPKDGNLFNGVLAINFSNASYNVSAAKSIALAQILPENKVQDPSFKGVTVPNLDIGDIVYAPGSVVEKTIYITNTSGALAALGTPYLSNNSYLAISDKTTCADTLADQSNCKIVIKVDAGSYFGTVNEQLTLMAGTSVISGTISKYSKLVVDKPTLTYDGSYLIASPSQTVTVSNTGYGAAVISQLYAWFYNGETLNSSTCAIGTVLNKDESCVIDFGTRNYSWSNVAGDFGHSGSYVLYTKDGSSRSIGLVGQTYVPTLSATISNSNFGNVYIGQSSEERLITIKNTDDNARLSINNVYTQGSSFSVVDWTNCKTIVEPGNTCTVKVKFNPIAEGDLTQTVYIQSNIAYPGSTTVDLQGRGLRDFDGSNMILPSSISYNTVAGTAQSKTFTVTNTQSVSVTLGTVSSNHPNISFVNNTCLNATLTPNQTCTFDAVFSSAEPVSFDARTILMNVTSHNRTIGATIDSSVSTAAMPVITSTKDSNNVDNTVAQTQILTVTGSNFYTTDFYVLVNDQVGNVNFEVTRLSSTQLQIRPTSLVPVGIYSLAVQNSAGKSNTVTINVTPKPVYPELGLSTPIVNFKDYEAYGTYVKTVILQNTGEAPMTLGDIYTDTNDTTFSSYFSLAASCHAGSIMAVGDTCYMSVIYSPATTGTHSTILHINSDGGNKQVSVSGNALAAAKLEQSTNLMDFQTVQGGMSSVLSVLIGNSGSINLSLNNVAIQNATGTGTFSITGNDCGSVLTPNSTCTITVTKTGNVQGTATAQLVILNSSSNASTAVIELSANTIVSYTAVDFSKGAKDLINNSALSAMGTTTLNTAGGYAWFDVNSNSTGYSYNTIPSTALSATQDYTLEATVFPTQTPASGSNYPILWQNGTGGPLLLQYSNTSNTGNAPGLWINLGATSTRYFNTILPINQWSRVAIVRQAGYLKAYVNGVQVGSSYSDNTSYPKATQSVIGGTGTASNGFQGGIGSVILTGQAGTLYSTIPSVSPVVMTSTDVPSIDFGTVYSTSSGVKTVKLTNSGLLNINNVYLDTSSIPGLTSTGCGTSAVKISLNAGASCTATLTFVPTASATYDTTVAFNYKDNTNTAGSKSVSVKAIGSTNLFDVGFNSNGTVSDSISGNSLALAGTVSVQGNYGWWNVASPTYSYYSLSSSISKTIASSQNFTLESWVYTPYSPATGDVMPILTGTTSADWSGGQSMLHYSKGAWTGGVAAIDLVANWGGAEHVFPLSSPLAVNQWHNVVIVRNNGVMSAYIDGAKLGTTINSTSAFNFGTTMSVGRHYGTPATTAYMRGGISRVALSTTVKSTSDFVTNPAAGQNPTLSVTANPTSYDFGNVGYTSSGTKSITYTNGGMLSASTYLASADPRVTISGTCGTSASPVVIAPAGTCTATLTFTPTDASTPLSSSVTMTVKDSGTLTTYSNSVVLPVYGASTYNTTMALTFDSSLVDSARTSRVLSVTAGAALTTAQAYSGTGSLAVGGSGYAYSSDVTGLSFGTGAYTVEMWIKPTALMDYWAGLLQTSSNYGSTSGAFYVGISRLNASSQVSADGKNHLFVGQHGQANGGACAIRTTSSTAVELNVWSHVAVTRDATGLTTIWLNGNNIGQLSCPSINYTSPDGVGIGRLTSVGSSYAGYIDQVKVIKGSAKYTSSFTPQ